MGQYRNDPSMGWCYRCSCYTVVSYRALTREVICGECITKEYMYEATGGKPGEILGLATTGLASGEKLTTKDAKAITDGSGFVTKVSDTKLAEGKMVRSPDDGKTNILLVFSGPMLERWAGLLTRGAVNYGEDNWLEGVAEQDPAIRKRIKRRYLKSAARHFWQWISGQRDEDHASAVFFNINGYEAMRATEPKESNG